MKKKFFAAVMVMAVWAAGSYSLGRHHGATQGAMELPSIQINWKGEEAKPTAEAEETNMVEVSNSACSMYVEQETAKK